MECGDKGGGRHTGVGKSRVILEILVFVFVFEVGQLGCTCVWGVRYKDKVLRSSSVCTHVWSEMDPIRSAGCSEELGCTEFTIG